MTGAYLDPMSTVVSDTVQGEPAPPKSTPAKMRKEVGQGPYDLRMAQWMTSIWGLLDTQATHARRMLARYGPALIEAMGDNATVGSCFKNLVDLAMAEDIRFVSPLGYSDNDEETQEGDQQAGDEELGEEIAEYCQRQVDNLCLETGGTFREIVRQGFNAMKLCSVGFEVVLGEPESSGPDAGRPTLKALLPRAQGSWAYVRNRAGRVIAYRVNALPDAELDELDGVGPVVPVEKYLIFCFMPDSEAPNGRSLYNMAIAPWLYLINVPPGQWRHMAKFGSPTWFGTVGEDIEKITDEDGDEVDPVDDFDAKLATLESCSRIAAGYGYKLDLIESKSDGSVFRQAAEEKRREITEAILGTALGVMEAQHYGKATAEAGQDVTSQGVKVIKRWMGDAIRHGLLRTLVKEGWGENVAARLTPVVQFGMIDQADFSRNANAFAKMGQAKMVLPQMILKMWNFLGAGVLTRGIKQADVVAWSEKQNAQPAAGTAPNDPANPPNEPA